LLSLSCVPSINGLSYQVSIFAAIFELHVHCAHIYPDVIGRRPVVFMGILGVAATTMMFGLSKSLASVLLARCLGGQHFRPVEINF
jgi:MFS family permease